MLAFLISGVTFLFLSCSRSVADMAVLLTGSKAERDLPVVFFFEGRKIYSNPSPSSSLINKTKDVSPISANLLSCLLTPRFLYFLPWISLFSEPSLFIFITTSSSSSSLPLRLYLSTFSFLFFIFFYFLGFVFFLGYMLYFFYPYFGILSWFLRLTTRESTLVHIHSSGNDCVHACSLALPLKSLAKAFPLLPTSPSSIFFPFLFFILFFIPSHMWVEGSCLCIEKAISTMRSVMGGF